MYRYIYIYIYTYTYIYIYMCVSLCIYIYIYIYTGVGEQYTPFTQAPALQRSVLFTDDGNSGGLVIMIIHKS